MLQCSISSWQNKPLVLLNLILSNLIPTQKITKHWCFPDEHKQDTSDNLAGGNGQLDPEGPCVEATILCAQLEERSKIHRNQVLSLLKDREISWKERNLEQRRLKNQTAVLSDRWLQSYKCSLTDRGCNEWT